MGYYENATICLNGHVSSAYEADYLKHCKSCGEITISKCNNCSTFIDGEYQVEGIVSFGQYDRPSYCHECGNPYPWTSKIIDNAVELLYLDEDFPNEFKELIKNALPGLIVETPTTPVAVAKYRKYIPSAADFVKDGMKNLLIDVVSETVKKSIWGI